MGSSKFTNQEIIQSLLIITAWQRNSPKLFVSGFKKCCVSNRMDGDDDILWNGSEEDGNVRS